MTVVGPLLLSGGSQRAITVPPAGASFAALLGARGEANDRAFGFAEFGLLATHKGAPPQRSAHCVAGGGENAALRAPAAAVAPPRPAPMPEGSPATESRRPGTGARGATDARPPLPPAAGEVLSIRFGVGPTPRGAIAAASPDRQATGFGAPVQRRAQARPSPGVLIRFGDAGVELSAALPGLDPALAGPVRARAARLAAEYGVKLAAFMLNGAPAGGGEQADGRSLWRLHR